MKDSLADVQRTIPEALYRRRKVVMWDIEFTDAVPRVQEAERQTFRRQEFTFDNR